MRAYRSIYLAVAIILALALAAGNMPSISTQSGGLPPEIEPDPAPAAEATPLPDEETPEPSEVPEETPEPGPVKLEKCTEYLTYKDEESDKELGCWCLVPEGATTDYPIILYLHSDKYSDNYHNDLTDCGIVRCAKDVYGEEYPFIILLPHIPDPENHPWEEGSTPDMVMGMLRAFAEDNGLDPGRTIITGLSRGAIAVWYLASRYPDSFSCAVPVSCSIREEIDIESLARVPIRAFVGEGNDDYGRYGAFMQGIVDRVREAGGDAELTVLAGKSHGTMEYSVYTAEVFEWMLSKTAAAAEAGPEHLEKCEELLTYQDSKTGKRMKYWCFIPEGATTDYPVVLFLHGDGYINAPDYLGGCGTVRSAKDIYGEKYPFILLMPNTEIQSWITGSIPDTVLGLVDSFIAEKGLSAEKVALTGHSRGAIGVWYLAALHPERFSCAVPVSCNFAETLDYESLAKVPIHAFVGGGNDDYGRFGDYMQGLVNKVTEAGGEAELTVIDGRNHAEMEYSAYTREVFEWMISQ